MIMEIRQDSQDLERIQVTRVLRNQRIGMNLQGNQNALKMQHQEGCSRVLKAVKQRPRNVLRLMTPEMFSPPGGVILQYRLTVEGMGVPGVFRKLWMPMNREDNLNEIMIQSKEVVSQLPAITTHLVDRSE
jgi:DNA-binding transcriptional MerR regulator